MKRQFLKVKQIADQTFSRTEKTEALNEDLVNVEKRVDLIKQSCHNTGKKIAACLQGVGTEASVAEKRLVCFNIKMQEWSSNLGDSSILGSVLHKCASIEEELGKELLTYETKVDKAILNPIINFLEIDFPNVIRMRKQLSKLIQDMDTTKTKYNTALKHTQQSTNNAINTPSKADTLQEELEDISMKVEQCRDNLTAELFDILSKEPILSKLFVDWYHLQVDHHRRELEILESALPVLDSQIEKYPFKPVFGQPLEEHLRTLDRQIASVIEACVCLLLEIGMDEEGLFRIAGSSSKIKKVKSAFDAGLVNLLDDIRDPHIVAGVLKSYLRELPEPLFTFQLFNDWLSAAEISDSDTRLQTLWRILNSLPEANFNNLRYLIKFLAKLASNSEINKMSSHNLAIVLSPNLIWLPIEQESTHLGYNMTMTNLLSSVVDSLITYADWFFPGDIEFFISTPTTPHTPNGPLVFANVEHYNSGTNGTQSESNSVTCSSNNSSNNPSPRSPRACHRPGKKPAPPIPTNNPRVPLGRQSAHLRGPVERSQSLANFNPQKIGNGLHIKNKSYEDLLSIQKSNLTKNGSVEDVRLKTSDINERVQEDMLVVKVRPQASPRSSIQKRKSFQQGKPPKSSSCVKNNTRNAIHNQLMSDDIDILTVDVNDISCSFQEETSTDINSKDEIRVFQEETIIDSINRQLKEHPKFQRIESTDENHNINPQTTNVETLSINSHRLQKINSITEIPEDGECKITDEENNVFHDKKEHSKDDFVQDDKDASLEEQQFANEKQFFNGSVSNGNLHNQTTNVPNKQYCTVIHIPGASSKPELPLPIAKERLRVLHATSVNKTPKANVVQNTRL
ncbi:rho GTPase-activating protein 44-like [Centruroides sculpturatus]|uniref:rho GTPase-activating protein 44-like n=1 Tax=Centruroides sculpturatus TaxID=218467 RepID=UPI000C6E4339|nr:rho GTPase-activating protein 44-like [Centruroides sculpturatus]